MKVSQLLSQFSLKKEVKSPQVLKVIMEIDFLLFSESFLKVWDERIPSSFSEWDVLLPGMSTTTQDAFPAEKEGLLETLDV